MSQHFESCCLSSFFSFLSFLRTCGARYSLFLLFKEIVETEEANIEKSDVLVVVMERATFGTAMEIKHAFDKNIPVIAFLLSDNPDFTSAALTYRVNKFVKSKEELIKTLKEFKK